MEENQKLVIQWIKDQKIKGCLTGSCLLGYFENSDVDFFAYSEAAFTQMFYAMYHNPMFQILNQLELWKAKNFIEKKLDNYNKNKSITFENNIYWNASIVVKFYSN